MASRPIYFSVTNGLVPFEPSDDANSEHSKLVNHTGTAGQHANTYMPFAVERLDIGLADPGQWSRLAVMTLAERSSRPQYRVPFGWSAIPSLAMTLTPAQMGASSVVLPPRRDADEMPHATGSDVYPAAVLPDPVEISVQQDAAYGLQWAAIMDVHTKGQKSSGGTSASHVTAEAPSPPLHPIEAGAQEWPNVPDSHRRLLETPPHHPDRDDASSSLFGPVDWRYKCRTCFNHVLTCPGHWGIIHLPWPVYHMSYIRKTLHMLSMCCYWCSRLKRRPETPHDRLHIPRFGEGQASRLKRHQETQFAYVHAKNHWSTECEVCGMPQPEYSIANHKSADSSFTSATLALVAASAASQVAFPGCEGMITPHRALNQPRSQDDTAARSVVEIRRTVGDDAVATVSMTTANSLVQSDLETISIQWSTLSHTWAPSPAQISEFRALESFVRHTLGRGSARLHTPDLADTPREFERDLWNCRALVDGSTWLWLPKVLLDIVDWPLYRDVDDVLTCEMDPDKTRTRWIGTASPRLALTRGAASLEDLLTSDPVSTPLLSTAKPTFLHLSASQLQRYALAASRIYRRQWMVMSPAHRIKLVLRPFTAKDALEILTNMSDDDVWRSGRHPQRAHPAWAIYTDFPVSPMLCRMSVSQTTGSALRIPSDLTSRIHSIMRAVRALWSWWDAREPIVSPQMWYSTNCFGIASYPKSLLDRIAELQREIAGYVYCSNKQQQKPAYSSSKNAGLDAGGKVAKKRVQMMQLVDGPEALQTDKFVDSSSLMDDVVATVTRKSRRKRAPPDHPPARPLTLQDAASDLGEISAIAATTMTPPATVDDAITRARLVATADYPHVVSKVENCQLNRLPIGATSTYQTKILQSVSTSWDGKTGRLRDKVFAKRSDFTARGVIQPYALGRVQDVTLGKFYTMVLTVPEIVNRYNRAELTRRVNRGCLHPLGASTVVTPNHGSIQLSSRMQDIQYSMVLDIGWIVERFLKTGDQLILNRNPSLHKYSKMGAQAVCTGGTSETMGTHPSTCPPFNSDYDGDEMNLHVPQNYAGRAECRHLMGIPRNMICAQRNSVIVRGHQESNLGAFLITAKSVLLTRAQIEHLSQQVQWIHPRHAVIQQAPDRTEQRRPNILTDLPSPWISASHTWDHLGLPAFTYYEGQVSEDRWSGKQLVSLQFPNALYYTKNVRDLGLQRAVRHQEQKRAQMSSPLSRKSSFASSAEFWDHVSMDALDRHVSIVGGILMSGSLCNQTIGNASNTIVQTMWKDYGSQLSAYFLSAISGLAYTYLMLRGFSTGTDDMTPGSDFGEENAFSPLKTQISHICRRYAEQSERLWHWLDRRIAVRTDARSSASDPRTTESSTDNNVAPWAMDDALQSIQQWWIEAIATELSLGTQSDGKMVVTPYAASQLCSATEHRIDSEARALFAKSGRLLGKTLADYNAHNSIDRMAASGSKGNRSNFVQMATIIGPQYCEGLVVGLADAVNHGRAFSSSLYFDRTPSSLGMVDNAFRDGMTPRQTIALVKGLRDALIDSATKTSRPGYIQRRLCQVSNSLTLNWDRTVTDSDDHIIQMVYAGDGMEPMELEHYTIPGSALRALDSPPDTQCVFTTQEWSCVQALFSLFMFENCQQTSSRFSRAHLLQNGVEILTPVPVHRLLCKFQASPVPGRALTPFRLNAQLVALCAAIRAYAGDLVAGGCAGVQMMVRAECRWNRKDRIQFGTWSEPQLEAFCEAVMQTYVFSWCAPGETVGVVGGQSIGEPATQMNMKNWNACGLAANTSANLMDGIPRLDEILNGTEDIRTRGFTVPLDPEWCSSERHARLIGQSILNLRLSDVISDHRQVWFHTRPRIGEPTRESTTSFYGVSVDAELTISNMLYAPVLRAVQKTRTTAIQVASLWTVDPRLSQLECGLSMDELISRIRAYLIPGEQWVARVGREHILFWQTQVQSVFADDSDSFADNPAFYFNWVTHGSLVSSMLDEMNLCGLVGVRSVKILKPSVSSVYPSQCWALLVRDGVFESILSHPAVLDAWVTTNDIFAVDNLFGIEAARQCHFVELMRVLGGDQRYVQSRHAALFSDLLTFYGKVQSATRFGLQDTDEGFLKRAGFEEARPVLFNAALNAESDHLQGIVSNLFMGSRPSTVGTGRTLLHMAKQPAHTTQPKPSVDNVKVDMASYDPDAPMMDLTARLEHIRLPPPRIHKHATTAAHHATDEAMRIRSYLQSMVDKLSADWHTTRVSSECDL